MANCESVFSFQRSVFRIARLLLLAFVLALVPGCATKTVRHERPFSFPEDTFSYANELAWSYSFDANGNWSAKKREPKPDYTLHCFVVARSAKQFFYNARFEPNAPSQNRDTNRKLIRQVVKSSSRKALAPERKIVIPGYANLREFSDENEHLLKEECGGAWQSYLQRGNWRMVFPFSRSNQSEEAERLYAKIQQNHAPVVHVVRFPSLDVNHALLLFAAERTKNLIRFAVYDPNKPEAPTRLTFDIKTQTFHFPQNDYFIGGEVDVYEVYSSFLK